MSLTDTITSSIDPALAELGEARRDKRHLELTQMNARVEVARRSIATLEAMLKTQEDRLAEFLHQRERLIAEAERDFQISPDDQAMAQILDDVQRHPDEEAPVNGKDFDAESLCG